MAQLLFIIFVYLFVGVVILAWYRANIDEVFENNYEKEICLRILIIILWPIFFMSFIGMSIYKLIFEDL